MWRISVVSQRRRRSRAPAATSPARASRWSCAARCRPRCGRAERSTGSARGAQRLLEQQLGVQPVARVGRHPARPTCAGGRAARAPPARRARSARSRATRRSRPPRPAPSTRPGARWRCRSRRRGQDLQLARAERRGRPVIAASLATTLVGEEAAAVGERHRLAVAADQAGRRQPVAAASSTSAARPFRCSGRSSRRPSISRSSPRVGRSGARRSRGGALARGDGIEVARAGRAVAAPLEADGRDGARRRRPGSRGRASSRGCGGSRGRAGRSSPSRTSGSRRRAARATTVS